MVDGPRTEKRRIERKKRQKELVQRRDRERAFLATVRTLVERGWLSGVLGEILEDGYDPVLFRKAVTAICMGGEMTPGDDWSWDSLASYLYQTGVDPHVVEGVLRKRDNCRRGSLGTSILLPSGRGSPPLQRASPRPAGARGGKAPPRTGARVPAPAPPLSSRKVGEGRVPPPRPPQGGRPRARDPLPAVRPVPLSYDATSPHLLLGRLLSGPHDGLDGVDLAREGAEILQAEQYDRLLSLGSIRGVEHLSHQIETVFRVLKRFRGRVLLADEVGLGKTIEACLVLKEYLLRGHVRRALILVPPALVGQWKAELDEKFGVECRTTLDPSSRADPGGFWSADGVLVASLALARSPLHRKEVIGRSFDLVIVDEAHHLKNRATRSWEVVNAIRSRFFLLLTATPVETDLTELYNLVTLLRPGTLGTEDEFRRRFVKRGDPAVPRDPERLRDLLREVMIRNTRALSGVLLPPRTARTIIVSPRPGERELYAMIVEASRSHGSRHRSLFRTLLEEGGSSPGAVARTAAGALQTGRAVDAEGVLRRIEECARSVASTAKLERLPEILRAGKTLIFSRFRSTMEEVEGELRRLGLPFSIFHGGMSAPERDDAVEAFARPEAAVMLCSEIGGEGRNLQFCHRLVNFDLPWNPMQIEQRIGRIHRIGQKETVEVTNLACAGTADERILEVLDRRLNLFELVIGEMDLLLGDLKDERDFGDQVFDIYSGSRTDAEVASGFDALAERLLEARGRLTRTKALDQALFGEDYEA